VLFFKVIKNNKKFSYTSELNQLFKPTAVYGSDYADYVETNLLFYNKFNQILINETVGLLTKGGLARFSCLKFEKEYLDDLKNFLNTNFIKENTKIYYIQKNKNFEKKNFEFNKLLFLNQFDLVLEKKVSFSKKLGNLNEWTFGIVTNGSRDKLINNIINAIQSLKIIYKEIIICGITNVKLNKKIKYIKFDSKEKKGWITKKKNLIINNSKYCNIAIIHDRVLFNSDFVSGIKKWGNYFFHITTKQYYKNKRTHDWIVNAKYQNKPLSFAWLMDYKDWNNNSFISGQLHIGKKFIFQKYKWDEKLFWGQSEDVVLSKKINDSGYLNRFNPYSSVKLLNSRFNHLPKILFSSKKLSKIKYGNIFIIFGRFIYSKLYKINIFKKYLIKLADITLNYFIYKNR
jgi:hypothetical protein